MRATTAAQLVITVFNDRDLPTKRAAFSVEFTLPPKVKKACEIAARSMVHSSLLAERMPKEWTELLETKLEDEELRLWAACVVWWDYHKQDNAEWQAFHAKYVRPFDSRTKVLRREGMKDALEAIGYTDTAKRIDNRKCDYEVNLELVLKGTKIKISDQDIPLVPDEMKQGSTLGALPKKDRGLKTKEGA